MLKNGLNTNKLNEINKKLGVIGCAHIFVIHKILSEFFQVSFVVVRFYQLVVVIERDDGIFRVPGNVKHLLIRKRQNIGYR